MNKIISVIISIICFQTLLAQQEFVEQISVPVEQIAQDHANQPTPPSDDTSSNAASQPLLDKDGLSSDVGVSGKPNNEESVQASVMPYLTYWLLIPAVFVICCFLLFLRYIKKRQTLRAYITSTQPKQTQVPRCPACGRRIDPDECVCHNCNTRF